jgi:hypothetical protein
MAKHYETHLYTFASAIVAGVAPAGTRAKAIKFGHTEGECMMVEKNPSEYIANGFKRLERYA